LKARLATAALLICSTAAWAVPTLTIAYHRDNHAAPLFDACLYPKEFRARYGLSLKRVDGQESYSLIDHGHNTLSLRLAGFRADSEVIGALLSGSAQVGILAPEEVLGAVLKGRPVRIVAPLQRSEDFLVANPAVPAGSWGEFITWVKARAKPTTVAYIGQYSMAALGFMQALEYEHLKYTAAVPGVSSHPESVQVSLVRADDRAGLAAELTSGRCDAALLSEPAATRVGLLRGCGRITRIDILPPGRFEDHPGTVIAATDSAIGHRGEDIGRFLELMAVATHYANNRVQKTVAAVCTWLGASPGLESIPLTNMGFSSRPDAAFTTGIWNWYFALRLRNAVPRELAGYMEENDWLGVPYDSLILMPALDRAGARIVK
jgi:ABC-type nitrate/sulfonate/bicarbonate transport system substrate-binding protein